jgi:hypothetical protein
MYHVLTEVRSQIHHQSQGLKEDFQQWFEDPETIHQILLSSKEELHLEVSKAFPGDIAMRG